MCNTATKCNPKTGISAWFSLVYSECRTLHWPIIHIQLTSACTHTHTHMYNQSLSFLHKYAWISGHEIFAKPPGPVHETPVDQSDSWTGKQLRTAPGHAPGHVVLFRNSSHPQQPVTEKSSSWASCQEKTQPVIKSYRDCKTVVYYTMIQKLPNKFNPQKQPNKFNPQKLPNKFNPQKLPNKFNPQKLPNTFNPQSDTETIKQVPPPHPSPLLARYGNHKTSLPPNKKQKLCQIEVYKSPN